MKYSPRYPQRRVRNLFFLNNAHPNENIWIFNKYITSLLVSKLSSHKMMESLVKDKTVLLAWNNGNSSSCVQDTVTELKKHIGGGHLSLEHVERLQLGT